MPLDPERQRLQTVCNTPQDPDWKTWGPYVSERAWGTVREDYSADGAAWDFLPHDWARSKAYRWGEDGLGGICDSHQKLCFAIALWNHKDPILKERAFGLSGPQGNHGEDVKEYYFFIDNTPTHSYMKMLYKYPQAEYPYQDLVSTNASRSRLQPEYELLDTGVFDENRYWDVFVEYAKESPEEILVKITLCNRGPDTATVDLLPTLWFRNGWSWGWSSPRGTLKAGPPGDGISTIEIAHPELEVKTLYCDKSPDLLFTDNETNTGKLYGSPEPPPFCKDGIHEYVVHGKETAVNPQKQGTKAAAHYSVTVPSGGEEAICLRLSPNANDPEPFGNRFDATVAQRIMEADAFYAAIGPASLSADARMVKRQAFAGLLWSKQYYRYNVNDWLNGDSAFAKPPEQRENGRNHDWRHVNAAEIISMPDTWEYPWFAAWDLAFHCVPLAVIDPKFAKDQLVLLCHEWYQHPNGQLPAYEWAFGDVNPPVQAWAAIRVYRIEQRVTGCAPDTDFLKRMFHKLLLNFTWWVNRKDAEGKNVFQGGFLGLDNIGMFDRSAPLPTGGYLEQSDGTSWMATYCLSMLNIAIELTKVDPTYEDMALKFFEHFVYIAHAMNTFGQQDLDLWDDDDSFYYDVLHRPDGTHEFLKVRSMVGLIPLLAVETIDEEQMQHLPNFKARLDWFVANRPDLCRNVADMTTVGEHNRRLLSIVSPERLTKILTKMLDESEFLSDHGLRAVSRYHKDSPAIMRVNGDEYRVDYEPAESTTGLFGGNSNWRGPIWFPLNHLLIEALQKYDYYLGPEFKVEFPTGSGEMSTLGEVAAEISKRLTRTFLRDDNGRRPVYGGTEKFQTDEHWRDLILFFEYFHGDNGAGIGASHQTGWTGLVAKLIEQSGE